MLLSWFSSIQNGLYHTLTKFLRPLSQQFVAKREKYIGFQLLAKFIFSIFARNHSNSQKNARGRVMGSKYVFDFFTQNRWIQKIFFSKFHKISTLSPSPGPKNENWAKQINQKFSDVPKNNKLDKSMDPH